MIDTPPPASTPTDDAEGMPAIQPRRDSLPRRVRQLFIGKPLSSENAEHTLLSKVVALPVFASDAISSVAYATQEIVLALGAAGVSATAASAASRAAFGQYTMLIALLIVALLVVVVISYWQTIFGYPSGGGSYIVSKDNLGRSAGLVAGAALLIDYVLTVSVSIAAGVQNLAGIPFMVRYGLDKHLVLVCCLMILLLTFANLRGLKESGTLFAIPTYMFVIMCYSMIFLGMFGPALFGWHIHTEQLYRSSQAAVSTGEAFGILVLFKAFANGCSAMTGTEAVSNGIPAFQEPKSRNAALTLLAMGVILGSLFIGISLLTVRLGVVYEGGAPAVIDQLSGAIFGKQGIWALGYYLTQTFTALILVLAANTSFADFPRLSSILARDRYLPKQLANIGDKLVFNNGIVVLGVFAALLIWAKKGNTDALIPLYAVGVFTAFTLSQSGMVVHWFKVKDARWQIKAFINGVGALATLLVLADIVFEKWHEGAYWVIGLTAVLVFLFNQIHRHYQDVAQQLRISDYVGPTQPPKNTVLVLVPALHRGVMPAIEYARSLSSDCRAIHICTDPERTPLLRERWEKWVKDVPLVIVNSPYRSLVGPVMRYLDAVQVERRNHLVTVVVPEFALTEWWHHILHGNSGFRLKLALLGRRDVVVANVRYYLKEYHGHRSDDALIEEEGMPASTHHGAHGNGHGDAHHAPLPATAQSIAAEPAEADLEAMTEDGTERNGRASS